MLPFRSGRAGIVSAFSAVFILVLLACVGVAAEKKTAKPSAKNPSPSASDALTTAKKPRPKPDEGLRDIPITTGHDAKGLVIPDFDSLGRMRGKLEAGVTRRLDAENIEFQGVKFTTFIPETEQPNLEFRMDRSVFNLKTQILNSNVRSTVKRTDFEISGDTMKFEMLTRQGTLAGNVKMIVRGKPRGPGNESE